MTNESDRPRRSVTTVARLSPDDVATRQFATTFRGLAETEVRSFLRRIADELQAARAREEELVRELETAERQLRGPRNLDEQELLDALGEEAAAVLRSAREAARDIRTKADEHAQRTREEAQEEAARVREEALGLHEVKTAEAQAEVDEMLRAAQEEAAAIRSGAQMSADEARERAAREAGAEIERGRDHGRKLVDEASALRERVLAELARRRGLLVAQIEELRTGREHLLDAYRVVKRSFQDATEALSRVEARAVTTVVVTTEDGTDPADLAAAVTQEQVAAAAAGLDAVVPAGAPAGAPAIEIDTAPAEPLSEEAGAEREAKPDVSDLFARLREGASTEPAPVPAEGDAEVATEAATEAAVDEGAIVAVISEADAELVVVISDVEAEPLAGAAPDPLAGRDEGLAPLLPALVKRAKRAVQDEQNAVLDALRPRKGAPNAQAVLASEERLATWNAVFNDSANAAYAAGRHAGGDSGFDDAIASEVLEAAVRAFIEPFHARVTQIISESNEDDPSPVADRVGARYREWRTQALESEVHDVLVALHARGVEDAVDPGTVLRWVVAAGGCCPDCADDALEPTPKGSTFPTGHLRPPAHAGCRCGLLPAPVPEAAGRGS